MSPPRPPRPPAFAFLVVIAVVRLLGRSADFLILARTPRLLRLWWRGLWAKPSPWRSGFDALMTARRAGVPLDDLVYGEAFVSSARALLRGLSVGPGRVVVDLGCGRGSVLLAAASLAATARGVDLLPPHVAAIGPEAARAGIDVVVGDARAVDDATLQDAAVVWLSWVTWSEATRRAVSERLRALPPGCVVVGVGHAVAAGDDDFEVISTPRVWSTWGKAEVVVSRRRQPAAPMSITTLPRA